MNRTIKAVLVAVALIVVGAVLAGCGLWGLDGAWDLLTDSGTLITIQETIPGEFTSIDIDVLQTDVELLPSPDGTCYYVAETYDNMICSCTVENGTLRIIQEDNRDPHEYIGIHWEETSLKLYLPEDTYETLTADGTTSDLRISANFRFGDVAVTTTTGDIAFYGQVDGNLSLTCTTGNIRLKDVSARDITAAVGTGDVVLEQISCDSLSVSTTTGRCHATDIIVENKLSATSGTGKKDLANVTCGSLVMESTTGSNELTNVTVSGDARLESNTGDWELDGFDAANIHIQASTGDVEATLRSEMIIYTDTNTGRVEVPRTTSGGICEISTNTGDIEIEIVP